MPKRSLAKQAWYDLLQVICRLLAVTLLRLRCHGRSHIPPSGGALVLSNHQSNFDPVLVGLCSNRRLNYLARLTLFRFPPFRWLIQSLDAIPIDREGSGLGGVKETLKRLKAGEMVLIFPEGTRTSDGQVQALKPGFSAIARRAGVPLVPVAVDGAYDAWPRHRRWPRIAVVHVTFGSPIWPNEIPQLTDDALISVAEQRIRDCHRQAAASRAAYR